jgi:hypothetical protein
MSQSSKLKRLATWCYAHARSLYLHWQVLGMARGAWCWVKSQLFKRHFEFFVPVANAHQRVLLRSRTTDIEVFQKIFIEREYALPFPLQPESILDLGANTGLATLFFALEYPQAVIVCVEPDPDNFVILKRQVAHLEKVTCIQAAVWSQDGHINLIDPVPAISISTLLAKLPQQRCDLLKVDIEGAEKEVFQKAASWINSIQSIVIELHDRYKPGCSKAVFTQTQPFQGEKWLGENVFLWR